jgi:RND superfamily putative drug exporter
MRPLAKFCFNHKWLVLLVWVIAVAGLNSWENKQGTNYTSNFKLPHTDSFEAVQLLERNAPKVSGDVDQIVIAANQGKLTDPKVKRSIDTLLDAVAHNPSVGAVSSPFADRKQLSKSGRIAYANVTFDVSANTLGSKASKAFVSAVTGYSNSQVQYQVEGQIAENGSQNNGDKSLVIGFLISALVLFIVFGSFLAMLLPLITTAFALGCGTALIELLSNVISLASFSSVLALLIGLGVGVDYSLFIVTRYRQGVLRGLTPEAAVMEALDTSGRAVLFAGTIVCVALLGMFALGISFLYGVAIAAAITVALTVIAALTLGPALLSMWKNVPWLAFQRTPSIRIRIQRQNAILSGNNRRALRAHHVTHTDESPPWVRWTDWMSKRRTLVAVVAAGVMILIMLPFFGMRLGSADAGSDPKSSTTRKAYDLLAEGFGAGTNGPFQLVAQINTPAQRADFTHVLAKVAATKGIVSSTKATFLPGSDGHKPVATADVVPVGSPQASSTEDLLHHLRDTVIPSASAGSGLRVLVSGDTAIYDDFAHVLTRKLPLFIGIVVLVSFLLLMVVFRSIVIPLTAAVMNMLSAGASFGIVTAIFQHGWGASLFGINSTGPIQSFLPVLIFPIIFGLSMDYEVFLMTRIYEEWHRRGDNRAAVTHGLAATGRTITAAAIIMVFAFGAFVLNNQLVVQEFGLGLAAAVLLDALIIRSALVPALMLLIGKLNWQIPAWLDRALPHMRIEGNTGPAVPEPEPIAH